MNSPPRPYDAAKASALGDRPSNQDRCLFLSNGETILLGLADGLGGHPRGDVAAQLLVDVCESMFRQAPRPLPDPEGFMLQCIGRAHNAIMRFGRRQDPPVSPRTTAVLAVIQADVAHWAHVGDSRLYLIRDHQVMAQTRDHSQVHFVRPGASAFPRSRVGLTRCLGGLVQPPATSCGPPTRLQRNDVIVLCSDGLWAQVPDPALVAAFDWAGDPIESSLRALVEQAAAAPNSDNVTAVALRWLGQPAAVTDQAGSIGQPQNPLLDQAMRHLHSMLKKISGPKP